MKKTPYYSVSKLFRQRDNPLIEDIYLKKELQNLFSQTSGPEKTNRQT